MTTRSQREFLKVQLLETQQLREMAAEHPLMSVAFSEREEELRRQIEALPLGHKEARTILFFSGEPVQGSMGIDASFAGRVLEPFQSMVMTDYADRFHGVVGKRGRLCGEAESRMLLTGLPRGSFGLELTRAENDELFDEEHLADTLAHVTKLVEAAGRSDEDFAAELDETAPRVVQKLREFLEVIAKGRAGLRLESGDFRCSMSPIEANEAFNRVAGTITKEDPETASGVFGGVLISDWRFNLTTDNGHKIAGKIDENLTQEQVVELNRRFFNEPCVAHLIKTTVLFKNGRVRTTYVLRDLEAAQNGMGE
jgi:hypothetical protein